VSLFQLSTPALVVGLFAVIIGATVVGHLVGRSMRDRSEGLREPFGAIQSAMLGFMALVMAFGLSLAVGRYESRRAAVVTEANALGTAYLRAQTLAEPNRTPSLGSYSAPMVTARESRIWSTVIASLRSTWTSAWSSPRYCARLYVNES